MDRHVPILHTPPLSLITIFRLKGLPTHSDRVCVGDYTLWLSYKIFRYRRTVKTCRTIHVPDEKITLGIKVRFMARGNGFWAPKRGHNVYHFFFRFFISWEVKSNKMLGVKINFNASRTAGHKQTMNLFVVDSWNIDVAVRHTSVDSGKLGRLTNGLKHEGHITLHMLQSHFWARGINIWLDTARCHSKDQTDYFLR